MDTQLYVEMLFKNHEEYDNKTIMNKCPNIDVADFMGETTLYRAICGDHPGLTKRLLECGAKYNTITEQGTTPLSKALEYQNPKIIYLLLDVSQLERLYEPHINVYRAILDRNFELLKKLHISSARRRILNISSSRFKISPLHVASIMGSIKFMEELIEYGNDINVQDIYGDTPLIYTTSVQNEKASILLLRHGANPNIKNKEGKKAKDKCFAKNTQLLSKLNTAETFTLIILAHKHDSNSGLFKNNITTDVFKVITRMLWKFFTTA